MYLTYLKSKWELITSVEDKVTRRNRQLESFKAQKAKIIKEREFKASLPKSVTYLPDKMKKNG